MVAQLGIEAGARTLALDYRLAPEHPCPAALQDALTAYRFLRAQGFAATRGVAFNDGLQSPEQFNCSVDELCETIASYLARAWLRHPFLDWIFVDALVTRELCAFGEAIKDQVLPSRYRSMECKGNLKEMLLADTKFRLQWGSGLFLLLGVVPPLFAWGAFRAEQESLGRWVLAIYALVAAVYFTAKAAGLAVRLGRSLLGRPSPEPPHQRIINVWNEMYEVWRRLIPPTVNPARVKEALVASEKLGAVWRGEVWSLVDQAIALDPAAWIVQRTS
ncbi:MAG TPA: alpha/beta hydrolase fold domain-containing protein [Rhodopila sp.]|jgi:hypothetical protein|nr:alpha/beta hydrolase fold domain-containing protein [Rhodopila sp.]